MPKKVSGGLVHDMPADQAAALLAAENIIAKWEALTPISRNEFLCWVEDAKQTSAKGCKHNIAAMLKHCCNSN